MNCIIDKMKKFVEDYWKTEYEIIVDCNRLNTRVLIFENIDNNSSSNKKHIKDLVVFRHFVYPDVNENPQYKYIVGMLKKHDIKNNSVIDLLAAKEMIDIVFNSKKINYKKIKQILIESKNRFIALNK